MIDESLPRLYANAAQLAQMFPWSVEGIRAKVRRGELQLGVHYFQPKGRGTEIVFKVPAIVELIEGTNPGSRRKTEAGAVPPPARAHRAADERRRAFDVEKAEEIPKPDRGMWQRLDPTLTDSPVKAVS